MHCLPIIDMTRAGQGCSDSLEVGLMVLAGMISVALAGYFIMGHFKRKEKPAEAE